MLNDPMLIYEDKSLDPAKKGGVQMHGGPGSKEYQKSVIDAHCVGKEIRVYWSQAGHQLNGGDHWITSICIKGELENMENFYRVLVENDTYCYFGFEDILSVNLRKDRPHSMSIKSKNNT